MKAETSKKEYPTHIMEKVMEVYPVTKKERKWCVRDKREWQREQMAKKLYDEQNETV